MNRLLDLKNLSLFKKDNGKKEYQVHDTISFEEVDDVGNYKLEKIPQNMLYETNNLNRQQKKQYIFQNKIKDYSVGNSVIIRPFDVRDLFSSQTRKMGYYHIAALQVLVKLLGNAGSDIPIKASIRDMRNLDKEQSILGLWSSNLYTGTVYMVIALDMTLSVQDKNIEDSIVLSINAGIDLQPGSKAIAVSTQIYAAWIPSPNPFRTREGPFELDNLKEGKSIIIKETETDIVNIPQPIPFDQLSYDLDFEFNEQHQHKVSTSNKVRFCVETNDGLKICLENPRGESSRVGKSKSSRFPSAKIYE